MVLLRQFCWGNLSNPSHLLLTAGAGIWREFFRAANLCVLGGAETNLKMSSLVSIELFSDSEV